jgi:hypothetical protein
VSDEVWCRFPKLIVDAEGRPAGVTLIEGPVVEAVGPEDLDDEE